MIWVVQLRQSLVAASPVDLLDSEHKNITIVANPDSDRVVQELVDTGLLEADGQTRARYYVADEPIRRLRKQCHTSLSSRIWRRRAASVILLSAGPMGR